MFKLRTAAGVGLAVAAVAAAAASPAPASVDPVVAATPAGGAQLAWIQEIASVPYLRQRGLAADGTLGPASTISWAARPVLEQATGTDAAGGAVLAWVSNDQGVRTVYARRRAPDGAFGPIQRLSEEGVSATELRMAVEPDGDAVAVWRRLLNGRQVIQGRRRSVGGTLGPVTTLSYTAGHSDDPEVAVAPGGAATVAWIRIRADGEFAQTRTLAADGSLSDYQRLSAVSTNVVSPAVTVDGGGKAVVSWARQLPTGYAFESRARAAGGTLGVVQTIAGPDAFEGRAAMAGNAAGKTVYAWNDHDGTGYRVKGRVRHANGGLGPAFDVDGGTGGAVSAALDPDGHATFAWRVDGDTDVVQLRRRSSAGVLGPVHTLSDPAAGVAGPHLAVDAGGKATVAWAAGSQWYARTVTPAGVVSPLKALSSQA